MSEDIERFRKHKVHYAKITQECELPGKTGNLSANLAAGTFLTPIAPEQGYFEAIPNDPDALLAELHGQIDAQKMSDLLDACQRECLQAVIRPFGLGTVLFDDVMGGNVVTVHNVRNDGYRKAPNTAYTKTGEVAKYDSRGDYNSSDYHGDKRYTDKNKSTQNQYESGALKDSYGAGVLSSSGAKKNLDHVISAKEIHDDPARILAEIDGPALANRDKNLKVTSEGVNKSKKQKTVEEFLRWVDDIKLPNLEKKIQKLENKVNLSDLESTNLQKLKVKSEELRNIDRNKIREADITSRKEQNGQINWEYYTSEKFAGNAAKTSLVEGNKMGAQQALGVLMEEFVRAIFAEVKDVWQNGFEGKVDDTFISALNIRLKRVAIRIQGKWKDAVQAFKDGAISGMFSNIVTVLINMFATTAANIVRMIREGFMALYRAFKALLSPREGLSRAEAADAALKILVAGVVTAGGIALEGYVRVHLEPLLGPLADYVVPITVGLATGVATACTVYLLDKIDLFGVHARIRHEQVMNRLAEIIDVSEETITISCLRINMSIKNINRNVETLNRLIDGPELFHLDLPPRPQTSETLQIGVDCLSPLRLIGPENP